VLVPVCSGLSLRDPLLLEVVVKVLDLRFFSVAEALIVRTAAESGNYLFLKKSKCCFDDDGISERHSSVDIQKICSKFIVVHKLLLAKLQLPVFLKSFCKMKLTSRDMSVWPELLDDFLRVTFKINSQYLKDRFEYQQKKGQ